MNYICYFIKSSEMYPHETEAAEVNDIKCFSFGWNEMTIMWLSEADLKSWCSFIRI